MKYIKKKTVTLMLASLVMVASSFGADSYKNSLKSIKFNNLNSNNVGMVFYTSRSYSGDLNIRKINTNTYVVILPETNSEMSLSPEVSGNIEKVNVVTMPYSNNNKGYTKITVTTAPNTSIATKNEIFVSSVGNQRQYPQESYSNNKITEQSKKNVNTNKIADTNKNDKSNAQKETLKEQISEKNANIPKSITIPLNVQEQNSSKQKETVQNKKVVRQQTVKVKKQKDNNDIVFFVLGFMLIVCSAILLYNRAANKLHEITGENSTIDIDDDPSEKKKKKSKAKQIKDTIKALDKMYEKTAKLPLKQQFTEKSENAEEDKNENSFLDLDELYNEKKRSNEQTNNNEDTLDTNDALDEFLSGFNFDEEEEIPEEPSFDEEFLNKLFEEQKITFSKNDMEKIQNLLNSEINEDTLKNINNFLVSNPIKQTVSKDSILEKLVTEYTINQNITFNHEDVEALRKLINVEIDSDFVNDLKTNPQKMFEMQEEIQNHKAKPHNSRDIITLKVSEYLPNLADALKKQGNKKIESNFKPDVVYFSEGYEYKVLNVDGLPDLSKEIDNDSAYVTRPSDKFEISVSGYDVPTLVTEDMPALDDMLKHPENYEEDLPEPEVADEQALLKSISNVKFKPFYDGSEEIEIINKFDEDEEPKEEDNLSLYEIQEEFKELGGNVEIITDDTELLEDLPKIKKNRNRHKEKHNEDAENLLKLIEEQQAEREKKKQKADIQASNVDIINDLKIQNNKSESDENLGTYIVENEIFSIISTCKICENMGCHLAKNDNGYVILAYIGDKVFKLKNYQKLSKEVIQSRLSEKMDDGSAQYIVRIGANKFILKVTDDNMEFVMDLC